MKPQSIYTIGHSNRDLEEFLEILKVFKIKMIVDVRSMPGSRKYPHFDQDALQESLKEIGIGYIHMTDLGGRRKVKKSSRNTSWRNISFQAYADYMETDSFEKAISELQEIAHEERAAIMCAEAVWWRCHRSMISDYLKVRGWEVIHIMSLKNTQEHPYTSPARVVDGEVVYY